MIHDQEDVDKYLPVFKYPFPLHPDKPVTMGAFGPPFIYTEAKKAQDVAFNNTMKTILKGWEEYCWYSVLRSMH